MNETIVEFIAWLEDTKNVYLVDYTKGEERFLSGLGAKSDYTEISHYWDEHHKEKYK